MTLRLRALCSTHCALWWHGAHFEVTFCWVPTLCGPAGLSGFFGWEPTVTQSALHTCIHSFLSWGRAGLGRSSLLVGFSHQETLCNMKRVTRGGQKVASLSSKFHDKWLCFLTMGVKQEPEAADVVAWPNQDGGGVLP